MMAEEVHVDSLPEEKTKTQFPTIVELNVGGAFMTTKLSTLTKDPTSALTDVFTGQAKIEQDSKGRFFIDCDPETFKFILEFLRFGILPPKEKAFAVYKYAKIFKLKTLCSLLEKFYSVQFYSRMKKTVEEFGERKEVYLKIKSAVLAELGESNCGDIVLVPVVYILNGDQPSCEKNHAMMVSSHVSSVSEARTFGNMADRVLALQTVYVNDCSNMSRILAHELCELGYCRQGFYYNDSSTQNCRFKVSCEFYWKLEFVLLSRCEEIADKRLKRP